MSKIFWYSVALMKIFSWNVNGIRAAQKKGLLDWLQKHKPDILCVQETKAQPNQLDEALLKPDGYHVYWNSAEKKGYSGVATFSRQEPIEVRSGFGIARFDSEGRVLQTEFSEFVLLNIYFPNGGRGEERLKYKLDFYDAALKHCEKLKKKGKRLIVTGDYNTAHHPIDLARPDENEKTSGFMPIERKWLDQWIADGQVDVFRKLYPDAKERYTWWDMRTRARGRNLGWRIDYHFVSEDLMPYVKDATIHEEMMGSDHCPIGLELLNFD